MKINKVLLIYFYYDYSCDKHVHPYLYCDPKENDDITCVCD